MTRKPYLHPNLSHAQPAPTTETKIEICHNSEKYKINLQKNTAPPDRPSKQSAHSGPCLDTSLQPRIPHPSFLPGNTTTTRGARAESKQRRSPKIRPQANRGQSRIHCLYHPTPTPAAPAPTLPPRGSQSSRTIARPAQGRALPSQPAAARGSHH